MELREHNNLSGGRRVIQILKLLGLWHYGGAMRTPYLLYSALLHSVFTIPYTIMMCMDVVQASDLEKFTNTMYMTLTELGLVAKLVNVWCYSRLLVDFFTAFTHDKLYQLQDAEEQQNWQRTQKNYSRVAFLYFTMSLSTLTTAFVGVLYSEEYELPFPYAPPFDWRTPRGYWYAYFYELLAMPITCLSNCAFDMIQCYMLLQLSLCFKVISGRLERMGALKGCSTTLGFSEVRFHRDFVNIVRLHARTKLLSQQCQTYISFPFLMQIICSSFVLCFSAYRLQKVPILENPSQFLTLVQANLIMVLQIFIPCYCGNNIIEYSSGLNNATYNAEWFRCSPKMRKYLVIYMEMLQRPVRVRAGDFFDISLTIFTKTMNNTYSLIALLLNMNK
ncbi:odorant receptor 94a-like [Bactrocera neohumeralis]|uniref:odorant receptor 94a-like n=1 Tax=Bactrocera neohumeralis TaxID=98809 RepID=UPI00216573A6|nr:odorant receptor 94a-like [Bactrocera neohumeralis]